MTVWDPFWVTAGLCIHKASLVYAPICAGVKRIVRVTRVQELAISLVHVLQVCPFSIPKGPLVVSHRSSVGFGPSALMQSLQWLASPEPWPT